ncbi:TetR/AcrR family transcriptional regulator [Saccharothrix violaceirubra]|uniref:AcrR family transcriptional regulator n=1 Tax=Saccharothrix violaceirubra TaxID=413306 RepID=A0A7W7WYC7_9PSEU|nr:TetR family transcriptional regulator [Saccharothrix violaceirubra]MBB4968300.1 AcrR family transcriptional regulator [Saccharothrix violaceirubra]
MARTGTDSRRERWKGHRETRRAEFVEAAIRAVARLGPDVGMDDIAAEAGVSKPVLYRHFTDKTDLYLAVGRRGTAMLLDRLAPALSQDGPIRARLRTIVDGYLAVVEEHPNLYRFVVRGPVERGAEEALVSAALARILGDHLRAVGVAADGTEPVAHALVGMLRNAADWWLDRRSMSRTSLAEHLTAIIWHAVDGLLRAAGLDADPDARVPAVPA